MNRSIDDARKILADSIRLPMKDRIQPCVGLSAPRLILIADDPQPRSNVPKHQNCEAKRISRFAVAGPWAKSYLENQLNMLGRRIPIIASEKGIYK
jgi:hypothetical protein